MTLAGGRLWRKLMSICEHKRAPVEHIILFFSFRGLCFWSVSIMKRFRRCADPCQRFWQQMTHTTYALGGEHARSVLEGMECVHCEPFLWEKIRSCSSLFLRELGRSSAPRGSGPAAAEAVKRLSSRRSQMEKAPLLLVPFLERIGAIICPPRLGSSRCWGSEETEFAAIADGACIARRARALCSRGNGVCSLWAFSLGKAPRLLVPFLERIGAIICPPRLTSSRCWGSEETEFAAIADGARVTSSREEFFISRSTAADESRLREEDVLSVNTSSDPTGSASQLVCPAM